MKSQISGLFQDFSGPVGTLSKYVQNIK